MKTYSILFCLISGYISKHGASLLVSQRDNLTVILQSVVGVYREHLATHDADTKKILDKTVILTASNYGYLNHLQNFNCFLQRLNLKFLVISLDLPTHNYILARTNMTSFYWITDIADKKVMIAASEFRSHQFNIITNRKEEAVHMVLSLGFNVLFIDTDVALLRDPFQLIIWKNVDYVYSHNRICPQCYNDWEFSNPEYEGNTGFYFARANNLTVKLWDDAFKLSFMHPGLDDQTIFWKNLKSTVNPRVSSMKLCENFTSNSSFNTLVICPLDGCMFSAGALRGVAYNWLLENLLKRRVKLFTVHANYIRSNAAKQHALDYHGYWLATSSKDGNWDGKCRSLSIRV